MEIRNPLPEEMPAVMELMTGIFGEQGIPADILSLYPEQEPVWYVGIEEGRIIGTIATFKENGETHMGRFTIDKAYQGRHLGTELILHCMEATFASGVEKIVGDARDTSIHIICKHGGRTTGETVTFYIGNATPFEICRKDYHR